MAYNSAHTGPEIDAAVEMLGQIQSARDATSSDRGAVETLASQVAANASQVASQASTVSTKTAQVLTSATAVEQAHAEVLSASAVAVDSKDAAALSAGSAQESQTLASASASAASQSQLAAGLSEQISAQNADSTSEDRAVVDELAQQVEADSASAALSAQNAAAVVTGGTATLASNPGKIPLANAQGKIDPEWLGTEIARTSAIQGAIDTAQAAEDSADIATARTARFLASVSTPPVIRDDGTPLQIGDRYLNTDDQAEYIYKSSGWELNDSLEAIAEIQDATDPAKGAALVGLSQNGTGAVARTTRDKVLEVVSPLDFGAAGDGVADDFLELSNAASAALLRGAAMLADGAYFLGGDIPSIHNVRCRGAGSLKLGSGSKWYLDPSNRNTGFSPKTFNTLYLSPAGSDNNSGIAPEYPLKTLLAAYNIIAQYGTPVAGFFKIQLAEGVYQDGSTSVNLQSTRGRPVYIVGPSPDLAWDNTNPPGLPIAITAITSTNPPTVTAAGHTFTEGQKIFIGLAKNASGLHAADGQIYTVTNPSGNTFQLSGVNGAGWAAYTNSGYAYDLRKSAPRAIFYNIAPSFDGNFDGTLRDFSIIGMPGDGLVITQGCRVDAQNIHVMDCIGVGATFRNGSRVNYSSGWVYRCQYGIRTINGQYTIGSPNPTSTLNTTLLLQKCFNAFNTFEMSNGHIDGNRFLDNVIDIRLERNSHCVAVWNEVKNTGAAKVGFQVEDGSFLNQGNNTWTGSFKPRVLRYEGTIDQYPPRMCWQNVSRATPGSAAAGSTTAVASFTVPAGMFMSDGQSFRVSLFGTGSTFPSSGSSISLRVAGVLVGTYSFPASALAKQFSVTFDAMQNGFNFIRIMRTAMTKDSGSSVIVDPGYFGVAFPGEFADVLVEVIVTLTSDASITMHSVGVEALGW